MDIPRAVLDRFAETWAEAIEGRLADRAEWGRLAKYRCCLLLGRVQEGRGVNTELKAWLDLWERGKFTALVNRLWLQQLREARGERGSESSAAPKTDSPAEQAKMQPRGPAPRQ